MSQDKNEKNGATNPGSEPSEMNQPVKEANVAASEARQEGPLGQKEQRPPARRMQHSSLNRLRDDFQALFDRLFGGWAGPIDWMRGPERFWDLEVQDTDKEVFVRAEAPGFEPNDFTIDLCGNTLTIRAEHKESKEEKQEGAQLAERHGSRMDRSITLPAPVDVSKADARYHNGVLEVHLPRTEEAQKRRIEVKG
jgi:HSP20 family protein